MVLKLKYLKYAIVKKKVISYLFANFLLGLINMISAYAVAGVNDADENQRLAYAVKVNDINMVLQLINERSKYITLMFSESSLLHVAANKGYINIAQVLIDLGAEVNMIDKCGGTPLFMAILASNIKMIELLIDNGANVNLANKKGFCPLHIAVSIGHQEVIEMLISNGACINSETDSGDKPMHAVSYNLFGRYTIDQCKKDYSNIIKQLKKYGCCVDDKNKNGVTALHLAVQYGNITLVKALIENGANIHAIDDAGNAPLHYAMCTGEQFYEFTYNNPDIVVKFEEYETRLSEHLNYCCFYMEHEDSMRIRCKSFDPECSSKIIEKLIMSGANINMKNSLGMTPLYLAVILDVLDAVKMLLKLDADIEEKRDNVTPLYRSVVKYVYEGDKKFSGISPNYLHILKELINYGAYLNATYTEGNTVLHLMVEAGNVELVQTLLENGADYTQINDYGELPSEMFCVSPKDCTDYLNDASVTEYLAKRQGINAKLSCLFKDLKCEFIQNCTPRPKSLTALCRSIIYQKYGQDMKKFILPPDIIYQRVGA